MQKYTFIDLFAGIGGFRYAFEKTGKYKCVFSSEINTACQDVYENNFGDRPFGDITQISTSDIPDFDVLLGGFPCQPFSICGKKKGFEDTRGTLFFDICRIIKDKKPKAIVLENVQHLTKHDKGRTFKVIIESLQDLGYNVSYKVLNAINFGLPQNRERIFIVGSKDNLFNFERLKTQPKTILRSFLDKSGEFEFLNKDEYTLLPKELIKTQAKTGLIFCGYRNKGIWKKGIRENTEHLSRCHRQPNRIYSIDGTHPTIPSQETSGRFFIYIPESDSVRKLTIDECYRIMGYPENFKKHHTLGEQYKQIGNSIAIPVVYQIAESIIEQNILIQNKTNNDIRGHLQQLTFGF